MKLLLTCKCCINFPVRTIHLIFPMYTRWQRHDMSHTLSVRSSAVRFLYAITSGDTCLSRSRDMVRRRCLFLSSPNRFWARCDCFRIITVRSSWLARMSGAGVARPDTGTRQATSLKLIVQMLDWIIWNITKFVKQAPKKPKYTLVIATQIHCRIHIKINFITVVPTYANLNLICNNNDKLFWYEFHSTSF